MLEGLLREGGLNAGLTSSPDFFRTICGFFSMPLSDSSSEPDNEVSADLLSLALGSVIDLECDIIRDKEPTSPSEAALKLCCRVSEMVVTWDGRTMRSPASGIDLLGELLRCCGIWLMAS